MDRHSTLPPPVLGDAKKRPPRAPFNRYRRRPLWFLTRNPWLLQRYTAMEVLRVVFWSALAVSLVASSAAAYQTVRGGIQLSFIWPFLARTFAYPFYFSLPMSLLFGVTLTYGRMIADLEISAARCHGSSHAQTIAPALFLGLLFIPMSHYFNGWVVPQLHFERRNLQQLILAQLDRLGSGVNRTILLPDGAGTLLVGAYRGTELRDVHLDLERSVEARSTSDLGGKLPRRLPERVTILAREGRIEIAPDHRSMALDLSGVEIQVPEKVSGGPRGVDWFHQKLAITESLRIPLSFAAKKPRLKDLSNPELDAHLEKLARSREESRDPNVHRKWNEAVTEWHRRLAYTLSSFTIPFLGVAMCIFLNRANRLLPFFCANLFVLGTFYPLLLLGATLGEHGILPSVSLALPNVVLVTAAALFTRRVLRR